MIIKPENIKIVVKCHECGVTFDYTNDNTGLNDLMINGIPECVCPCCGDGEIELSHFETI